MELTGAAASRTMKGDEKSQRMKEKPTRGCSVRVERWVRPPWLGFELFFISPPGFGSLDPFVSLCKPKPENNPAMVIAIHLRAKRDDLTAEM